MHSGLCRAETACWEVKKASVQGCQCSAQLTRSNSTSHYFPFTSVILVANLMLCALISNNCWLSSLDTITQTVINVS